MAIGIEQSALNLLAAPALGTIFRHGGDVQGLKTAATPWCAAAAGVPAGFGAVAHAALRPAWCRRLAWCCARPDGWPRATWAASRAAAAWRNPVASARGRMEMRIE